MSNIEKIHFKQIGQGQCIVLLHGYLENSEIWNGIAEELSRSYQVLLIDIPGDGKSKSADSIGTMDQMAETLDATLTYLDISKVSIIGHSMGGYVALAFANLFPNRIAGLCLFHSTPFADSLEKKQNRTKEVELILKGELPNIVDAAIPIRFANSNLEKNHKEISWAKEIANRTSTNLAVSSLKAMESRPDRNHVIENASHPTMFIFGEFDNHIPLNAAKDLENRHKKTRTVYLANSGHMGFIEERDQALNAIKSFLKEVFN